MFPCTAPAAGSPRFGRRRIATTGAYRVVNGSCSNFAASADLEVTPVTTCPAIDNSIALECTYTSAAGVAPALATVVVAIFVAVLSLFWA